MLKCLDKFHVNNDFRSTFFAKGPGSNRLIISELVPILDIPFIELLSKHLFRVRALGGSDLWINNIPIGIRSRERIFVGCIQKTENSFSDHSPFRRASFDEVVPRFVARRSRAFIESRVANSNSIFGEESL